MNNKDTIQYAEKEKINIDALKIPHRDDYQYEFELKVKFAPFMDTLVDSKGIELPPNPDKKMPKRGAIFSYFFNNSGHVFFELKIKDKNQNIIGRSTVGYSADDNVGFNRLKLIMAKVKKTLIGVPGIVFDQEKSNGRYHLAKTYQVERKNFENLLKFIEKNKENPPIYHWPVAMNCVRFTKRCAKVAGIKDARALGIINLPITTIAYLGVKKVVDSLEKAAKKLKKMFSDNQKIPFAAKDNKNSSFDLVKALKATKDR